MPGLAISPITIATHGLLNSPLSVAAIRGHLHIITDVEVEEPLRGGDSSRRHKDMIRWKHPFVQWEERMDRLHREDDEILAVIIASMRYLQ